jgi:hypothetical protein
VPDSSDYEWLGELLARPDRWTAEEAKMVRRMIEDQALAIEAEHPKNLEGRRSKQAVLDEMVAALRVYIARGKQSP